MDNILCVKFDNSKEWEKDFRFTNGKIYNLFQRETKSFPDDEENICYYTMCDNNNRYMLLIKDDNIRTVMRKCNGALVDDESIFEDVAVHREELLNQLGI